ncbi:MAG: AAA family ATPase [Candidatus Competibacterales bacterium]
MLPSTLDCSVFSPEAEPRVFYNSPSRRRAYAALLSALKEGRRVVALTGPAGCGKRTLLRRCGAAMGQVNMATLDARHLTLKGALSALSRELTDTHQDRKYNNIQQIQKQLSERHQRGERWVVALDNADATQPNLIKHLIQINNLPSGDLALFTLVLLAEAPSPHWPFPLCGETPVTASLEPFHPADVNAFIQLQLQAGGHLENQLFSPQAIERIAHYSQGVPAAVNALCELAWTTACQGVG